MKSFHRVIIRALVVLYYFFPMEILDGGSPFLAAMIQEPDSILFTTSEGFDPSQWRVVNDGVMGGISRGSVKISPDGKLQFNGSVSLENNGGFASIRRSVDFPIDQNRKGVSLRLRGDGNDYQFRLRLKSNFDGIAYRKTFSTKKGEWQTIRLLFDDFIPSFRGRKVPNTPTLNPSDIRQMGFLISDYQEGSFQIEIESILLF